MSLLHFSKVFSLKDIFPLIPQEYLTSPSPYELELESSTIDFAASRINIIGNEPSSVNKPAALILSHDGFIDIETYIRLHKSDSSVHLASSLTQTLKLSLFSSQTKLESPTRPKKPSSLSRSQSVTPTSTPSKKRVTFIALYHLTTKEYSVVHICRSLIDIVSASLNEERNLLVFTLVHSELRQQNTVQYAKDYEECWHSYLVELYNQTAIPFPPETKTKFPQEVKFIGRSTESRLTSKTTLYLLWLSESSAKVVCFQTQPAKVPVQSSSASTTPSSPGIEISPKMIIGNWFLRNNQLLWYQWDQSAKCMYGLICTAHEKRCANASASPPSTTTTGIPSSQPGEIPFWRSHAVSEFMLKCLCFKDPKKLGDLLWEVPINLADTITTPNRLTTLDRSSSGPVLSNSLPRRGKILRKELGRRVSLVKTKSERVMRENALEIGDFTILDTSDDDAGEDDDKEGSDEGRDGGEEDEFNMLERLVGCDRRVASPLTKTKLQIVHMAGKGTCLIWQHPAELSDNMIHLTIWAIHIKTRIEVWLPVSRCPKRLVPYLTVYCESLFDLLLIYVPGNYIQLLDCGAEHSCGMPMIFTGDLASGPVPSSSSSSKQINQAVWWRKFEGWEQKGGGGRKVTNVIQDWKDGVVYEYGIDRQAVLRIFEKDTQLHEFALHLASVHMNDSELIESILSIVCDNPAKLTEGFIKEYLLSSTFQGFKNLNHKSQNQPGTSRDSPVATPGTVHAKLYKKFTKILPVTSIDSLPNIESLKMKKSDSTIIKVKSETNMPTNLANQRIMIKNRKRFKPINNRNCKFGFPPFSPNNYGSQWTLPVGILPEVSSESVNPVLPSSPGGIQKILSLFLDSSTAFPGASSSPVKPNPGNGIPAAIPQNGDKLTEYDLVNARKFYEEIFRIFNICFPANFRDKHNYLNYFISKCLYLQKRHSNKLFTKIMLATNRHTSINDMKSRREREEEEEEGFMRYQILEKFYLVMAEMGIPFPDGFLGEYSALGMRYLPKNVFLTYLEKGVFISTPTFVEDEVYKGKVREEETRRRRNEDRENSSDDDDDREDEDYYQEADDDIFKFDVVSKLPRRFFMEEIEKHDASLKYIMEHFYSLVKIRNVGTEKAIGGNSTDAEKIEVERSTQRLQKTDSSFFVPGDIFVQDFKSRHKELLKDVPGAAKVSESSKHKARFIYDNYMNWLAQEFGLPEEDVGDGNVFTKAEQEEERERREEEEELLAD